MRKILFLSILALVFSCIKPEAKNSEADILSVTLPEGYMSRNPEVFNDSIVIHLSNKVLLKFLSPEFKLTEGATIFPESGTLRSFYQPQYYDVTSENGLWKKTYAVTAIWGEVPAATTIYDFENVKMDNLERYHIFYEKDESGTEKFSWASGNAGYALTGAATSLEDYPAFQSTLEGNNHAACLTTCTTGSFGPMVGMPIAAGNLFIGSFDMASAVSAPLKATHFGMQWNAVPVKFSGRFQYTPGPVFYVQDTGSPSGMKVDATRKDRCNIYAVFFETTQDMPYLDGENSLSASNSNIISTAIIPTELTEGSPDWKEFELEFVAREGKSIDQKKMQEGKYSIAIVMTSSIDGATFSGAPGSRLYVDNLKVYSQVL